jgi:hypothetical protein
MDLAISSMVYKPLDNREVWHLDKRACYALTQGDSLNSPNVINPLPIRDVYLVKFKSPEAVNLIGSIVCFKPNLFQKSTKKVDNEATKAMV